MQDGDELEVLHSSTPLLCWYSGTGTVPEVIFRTAPQIGACPAIPILYLLRKVIFMSVLRVTNFFSFLCKVESRAEERFPLYSIQICPADLLYLCTQANFTSFKAADLFTPVRSESVSQKLIK
jgi:hypothetical protein